MLKSENRLTTKEFETTFQKGTKWRSTRFLFVFMSGDRPQVGIAVPKKIYKKAHERNQIKRFVYNCLHKQVSQGIPQGSLLVIVQQ